MDKSTAFTVGIDLGDRVAHACAVRGGEVIERFSFKMSLDDVVNAFVDRDRCTVALEAGAQCAWVTEALQDLGFEVVVANPRKLKAISTNTRKNDRNDAEMLARLVAVDRSLLSPVTLRDPAQQRALNLLGTRHALVEQRTAAINRIRSCCKSVGLRLQSTAPTALAKLQSDIPAPLRDCLAPLFALVSFVNGQIHDLDTQLQDIAERDYPVTQRLQTVKGVGPVTSLAFVLVLGQFERFPSGRHAAAYLGLVPRQDQSGAIDRQLGISKTGNTYLRQLLTQCAHSILGANGQDSELRRWGLAIAERGGKNAKKRAVVATARKLAVLLYCMWKHGTTWNPEHNAAARPPAPTAPKEGCPDLPALDDCARVLDRPGRLADCSVDRGSDPSMHRAPEGPSTSADRSMDRRAPSPGTPASTTPPRRTRKADIPPRNRPADPPPIAPLEKTASRAFQGKRSGSRTRPPGSAPPTSAPEKADRGPFMP